MFDSFKKLGSGLLSTAKNSFEFAQGKTTLMKAYYNLGEKVVKDYQDGNLKVSDDMEIEINNLIKVIEETNKGGIVDKNVIESFNEIKEQATSKKNKEETVTDKTEEKVEVKEEAETDKTEEKEKVEVKAETKKTTSKKEKTEKK
jgi:hypothetical protein